MSDISYDETLSALASEGLVDPAPEAGTDGDGLEEQGGILGGALGSTGTLLAAGFVGSKLGGGKATANPVVDVVTSAVDSSSKDTSASARKTSGKGDGILDKIGSIPGVASGAVQGAVQSILEEFVGSSGSGSIGGEFTKAMQEISAKDKKSRPLPSISNILPSAAKSVTNFIPGIGD